MAEQMLKPGDTVYHRPTGETWVVAYADPERDLISWIGWPEGVGNLSDCEVKSRCSDEQSQKWIERFLDPKKPHKNDHRIGEIKRLYVGAQ